MHYHGRLTDGKTFDSSEGRQPLEFRVGEGMVIRGFDRAMLDMQVGDKKTVNIAVEEAYGAKNTDLIMEFPHNMLPSGLKPEIGMQLQMNNREGRVFPVKVVAVGTETVTLDANHPLAGEELIFDIELVEIG